MNEGFLGDSYDLVKRFWREHLSSIAPLLAHPRFCLEPLRPRFTLLTTIPFFDPDEPPDTPFGMFLDPHTGIPLPKKGASKESIEYAPVQYIATEIKRLKPLYAVCFEQSHDRRTKGTKIAGQSEIKRKALKVLSIASFYYVSHAPFLFMSKSAATLDAVRQKLISLGIPETVGKDKKVRLQPILS